MDNQPPIVNNAEIIKTEAISNSFNDQINSPAENNISKQSYASAVPQTVNYPYYGYNINVPQIPQNSPNVEAVPVKGAFPIQYSFPAEQPTENKQNKPYHRRRPAKTDSSKLYCHKCNKTTTPEWRTGPDGPATLCNACGLKYAKEKKNQRIRQQAQQMMTMNPGVLVGASFQDYNQYAQFIQQNSAPIALMQMQNPQFQPKMRDQPPPPNQGSPNINTENKSPLLSSNAPSMHLPLPPIAMKTEKQEHHQQQQRHPQQYQHQQPQLEQYHHQQQYLEQGHQQPQQQQHFEQPLIPQPPQQPLISSNEKNQTTNFKSNPSNFNSLMNSLPRSNMPQLMAPSGMHTYTSFYYPQVAPYNSIPYSNASNFPLLNQQIPTNPEGNSKTILSQITQNNYENNAEDLVSKKQDSDSPIPPLSMGTQQDLPPPLNLPESTSLLKTSDQNSNELISRERINADSDFTFSEQRM